MTEQVMKNGTLKTVSRSPSIGGWLRRLSLASSASALLAASLALLFVQVREQRNGIVRRYGTVADLLAFNVRAAVDFEDPESARRTLSSLAARREVSSAGIVVGERMFAAYSRKGPAEAVTIPAALSTAPGHRLGDRMVTIWRPILARGRPLGILYVQSTLDEIAQTQRRFAWITAIVAIPALLVAVVVCHPLQRAISMPLLALAGLAEKVSATGNYSVRAPQVRSAAEVEQFVATFNQMLAEIEEARSTLERRVAERTAELELRAHQLEEKRLELAAANQELEAFSYSVSHDLRAPLRAIDGFSQALLSDYDSKVLDERGMHYLGRVRGATKKMATLIDDMLHLSRVSRRTLQCTEVSVTAIAEQIAEDLGRADPEHSVSWAIAPEMRAEADPHLLTIAMNNLLGNSWKFTRTRPDARIEVGWERSPEHGTVFHVRDNGAGFDMAYANKLFAPFQRLHSEAEFEGTGIGLATVKRIVTRHGGTIWAEAAEGLGAAFHFTLGGKS